MTERDLENLKHLPVPAPRPGAKRAALDAAMAAFDAASTAALPAGSSQEESEVQMKDSAAAGSSHEETQSNVQDPPQGNIVPLRQTEASRQKRSFLMRLATRQNMALAASLAALMIAAPIAFQRLQQRDVGAMIGAVSTELQTANGGGTSQPTAPSAPHQKTYHYATPRPEPAPVQPSVAARRDPTAGEKRKFEDLAQVPRSTDAQQSVAETPPAPSAAPAPADAKIVDALKGNGGRSSPDQYIAGNEDDASVRFTEPERNAADKSAALQGGTIAPSRSVSIARLGAEPDAHGRVAPAPAARRAEAAKPDPYAWMGGDADEKKKPTIIQEENRDKFDAKDINPIKQVAAEPVSTFSIDVDTASYAFVRRALNAGRLPPKDAVRVEEMINYFPYAYPAPDNAETPFKPTVTVVPAPWNPRNKLVHVAVKGYDLKSVERPRANLVFLMDVSGSMEPADRLPLLKNAFRMLVDQLRPDDTVAIVTYASGSGIALEPTRVAERGKILTALDRLGAGGSTAGAAGIADAYRLAESGFEKNAVNRVILATDGDFNVGITDQGELKSFIERKRQSGIFLSILGVGQGNHNDALMQTLAQNGNGTAAYVDTLSEARKVLVDEASATLFTIAKDVKVQIEWNPAAIAEYRLIGYETRNLKREDFNNDRVDAGDIGSGHTVTAIYEVTPVGAPKQIDDLRYSAKPAAPVGEAEKARIDAPASSELGFLKLRYKRPNENVSQLLSLPVTDAARTQLDSVSADIRFSVAVAAFGQMMKDEPYTQGYSFDDVLSLAQSARGDDLFGYRAEFLNLVRLSKGARP